MQIITLQCFQNLLKVSSKLTKIGEAKLQEVMEADTSNISDKSCVTVSTLNITKYIIFQ